MISMVEGLGERIKSLRATKGMTQQALATAVGASQSAIAQIEAGKIPSPRWHLVLALAKALGVTPNDLRPEESPAPE